ncbi:MULTISPECIES: ATP synthase F1 subunit delta [Leuconostoc]|uniref:ATP synthase subunit delta n=2 Tax=Leuconostoc TaxID=1243 RepID=A0AAN2UHD3_9LACO|nr:MULTISPECIES: ATP synthase F1 subunit delta [Leuconostoc]MBZ5946769.1 F0F1 ATP synthase subunit delta [Leuconostoc gasicomitatum]MBZ5948642.1 F0F1 ATP synthase subunit delta [Leuconostoc gasicomitatum]MBZ5952509.1 F0F1 ATP synthase subunit delta [Leuconostoc gasicomitatum]MBZ5955600.1 F0F1 ATP synthase subunit delta [Leuconostoc gasicomitatum]MBZ5956629.1 F0F1 ATP synthase subunit delta [Leuconostoc gasicomitatum]
MAKNLKDIADQYAKAIFELSSEQNNIEETRTSLNGIKTVLNDNPNFVMVVTSDDVDPASRDNLLQTLTNGASESIQNLVKLLVYNNRLNILSQVVDAFGDRYNEANGIVDVTATTAVTLDETRLDKLAAIFASKTGAKHVNLKNVVDESILGGVILKSQSTLIDGSLQTKIAKMKAQLLG